MSKRKKPVQLLGPDGKPYVAPPKPKPEATYSVTYETEKGVFDLSADITYLTMKPYHLRFGSGAKTTIGKPHTALHERVADDVAALTADFEGEGGEEMPIPPADLTMYADAYASAVKKCPHENSESTMYARKEMFCHDCRRYFTGRPGIFGGWP